jgi:hypothetical protein
MGERRVAERTPVDRAVVVRVLNVVGDGHGPPIPARLEDLSATGVGLRLSQPIAPGRHFLLAPPACAATAAAPVDPLSFCVVRCTPLGRGQFHVGARFVRNPAGQPAS